MYAPPGAPPPGYAPPQYGAAPQGGAPAPAYAQPGVLTVACSDSQHPVSPSSLPLSGSTARHGHPGAEHSCVHALPQDRTQECLHICAVLLKDIEGVRGAAVTLCRQGMAGVKLNLACAPEMCASWEQRRI